MEPVCSYPSGAPIRVLVVDDSALVRSLLTEIINREPDMKVVAAARDPLVARELIRELDPDVLTLDVEMPHMSGVDFLEKLMRLRPMPVVMISSLTEKGAQVTLRALELGAVDFVAKPKLDIRGGLEASGRDIVDKIRTAAVARVHRARRAAAAAAAPKRAALHSASIARLAPDALIVIGASTGGTEAIKDILVEMPPAAPGIVITQHMPPGFTRTFAERLDSLCAIRVKEAEHGEPVLRGHAYIAPGNRHLRVRKSGLNHALALVDDDPVNRHRPSVEVLFRSAAQCPGGSLIGIMLTGMGKDGAAAMLEMKRAGAWNIAQDQASCVVFGMPKEAIAMGGVDEVLPLSAIAERVLARLAEVRAA